MAVPQEPPLDSAGIQAVAREVATMLAGSSDARLLTAQQVAARFNVERSWVYAHAEELGVVRLGSGPRPRLRFDAAVVAVRLRPSPGRMLQPASSTPLRAGAPLLPIRLSPQRRNLDSPG